MGQLLRASHDIRSFRIEIDKRGLKVLQTRVSHSFTVIQGTKVGNMQLHGEPVGIDLSFRLSDMTQSSTPRGTIKDSGVRSKSDSLTCQKNTAEILSIIVTKELSVPRTGNIRQFAAYQPCGRLHVNILSEFVREPLRSRLVLPQRGGNELRSVVAVLESSEGRGEQDPFVAPIRYCFHLQINFVGSQKIISVEPLDVVSMSKRKSLISGGCSALVALSHHTQVSRFKLSGNGQSLVSGAVINNDNLLRFPRLFNR